MSAARVIGVLALVFVVWFLAGFFGFAGEAHAGDIICRTDYMSGLSYEYCHWTDSAGVGHRTETICRGNNYCTTRDVS